MSEQDQATIAQNTTDASQSQESAHVEQVEHGEPVQNYGDADPITAPASIDLEAWTPVRVQSSTHERNGQVGVVRRVFEPAKRATQFDPEFREIKAPEGSLFVDFDGAPEPVAVAVLQVLGR